VPAEGGGDALARRGIVDREGKRSSGVISGSRGAPEAAASALTIRSIAASTRLRTPSSKLRTLSLMTASSGMTFSLVPACNEPMVTTAASAAASSRDRKNASLAYS
jgi:hypothetical protein